MKAIHARVNNILADIYNNNKMISELHTKVQTLHTNCSCHLILLLWLGSGKSKYVKSVIFKHHMRFSEIKICLDS